MKTLSSKTNATIISLLLSCSATYAFANGERPARKGPPPEALTACESAAEGDSCSFTSPRGEVSGQCVTPPKEGVGLACKPADR